MVVGATVGLCEPDERGGVGVVVVIVVEVVAAARAGWLQEGWR